MEADDGGCAAGCLEAEPLAGAGALTLALEALRFYEEAAV